MRQRAIATVGLCLAAAGCGGADHRPAKPRTRAVHRDGVVYAVPVNWHVAERSLTPHLTNPREVFTAGTGRLAGGVGLCAMVPSAALQAMRAQDVLVTVQERIGDTRRFPARPRRFDALAAGSSEADDCAGRNPAFRSHWFEFRDHGRGFHVLVAVGTSASSARVREANELLDSLRIAPRRPVRIDADSTLPVHDERRGLDYAYPVGWRIYDRPLTQVASPEQSLALGTFRLHQRRPDPNCMPRTALAAKRPGDGFIFLFEYDGLNRTQLARFPRRPARLKLPARALAYECMGVSRMVVFRDGDRAFQAHVYGPPARRRQALAILDSLRVRPSPFDPRLHAAVFPEGRPWRTRIGGPSHERPHCLRQRVSWASTVPFTDAPDNLPPHSMIEALPPDGIIIAAIQFRDRCRRPYGVHRLSVPLSLRGATRMGFEGPRGDDLPLYRISGRFAGRYDVDVWVFFGRHTPTPGQRAAANRELRGIRWPAWL